ncbi:tetratricopeptide repeat protein [Campylobacter sp.]|uniref:tetratricopeptide repeat protein n=1 Tax=Campylobacter sp. TaxID=205 RepID=UPI003FA0F34F
MRWRKILVIFISIFFNSQLLLAEDNKSINLRLMQALLFQDSGDVNASIQAYINIFKDTNQKTYLKEAIKLAFATKNENLNALMSEGEKNLKDDSDFIRIKIANLVNFSKLNEAKNLMQELATKEPNAQNLLMLGTICMMQNEAATALKYFEEAYLLKPEEENLLRIVDILINRMDKIKDATKYLEKFKEDQGCTLKTCELLAEIYSQQRNFPKVIELFEELYDLSHDTSYLDKIVQFFIYEKNYKAAIEILKKYSYNDTTLIDLYAATNNFGDAYILAVKIYNESRDLNFLAKAAIYEYEMNKDSLDEQKMTEILDKFEASVPKLENDMFFNYYGYLLIDHDIDPRKGVELVQKALDISPDSPYYEDSLAWGYFKLGECKKAKSIMQHAMKDVDFRASKEAKEHLHLIERCIINLNKRLKK